MYSLRAFTENSEVNNWLGDQYEIIRREESYGAFAEQYRKYFDKSHVADNDSAADEISRRVYAFILNEHEQAMPVYKGQKNYIVTESGKTYSNITYK